MDDNFDRVLYLRSIRELPEKFIDQGTRLTLWQEDKVFAANPKYPPIKFENGKWSEIKIETKAVGEQEK